MRRPDRVTWLIGPILYSFCGTTLVGRYLLFGIVMVGGHFYPLVSITG